MSPLPLYLMDAVGVKPSPTDIRKSFTQTHLTDGSSALSGAEVKGPLRGAEEAIKGLQRQ